MDVENITFEVSVQVLPLTLKSPSFLLVPVRLPMFQIIAGKQPLWKALLGAHPVTSNMTCHFS